MYSDMYGPLPIIYVNRTIGEKIYEKPEDYRIDFSLNQKWNESVESYNVIGQLNGTNPNETVVISCLYDSNWGQGTGDSAIGMAMVLGIAKYMKECNIKPKCNVKFIGFSGEEYGLIGAYYYEAFHRNEKIITVIDLNQLGFTQARPDKRLHLRIYFNNESFNSTIRAIADRTNYVERTGNVSGFGTVFRSYGGPASNALVFADANKRGKRSCNTFLFVKDGPWLHHHRDGLKHTEGDVLKYFNWTDVNVTGEMVWNVTKYFTVDDPLD
jgi:Zn-dependent M28 family amino/carboxypeptidase